MVRLLTPALWLLCTFTLQGAEWEETKSQEGNFKASFPAEAQYFSQDLETEQGPLKMHFFAAETNDGEIAYMVMYNDYNPEHVKATGAEALLKNAQGGALKSIDGRITKEEAIKLGAHAGRQFSCEGKSGETEVKIIWRLYLVGNRMYQVGIVQAGAMAPAESVQKFHDSFALLRE